MLQKAINIRRKLKFDTQQCVARLQRAAFRRRCRAAMDRQAARADVLMGPNLSLRGGVRNHMVAIRQHSRSNVELFPEDELTRQVKRGGYLKDFKGVVQEWGFHGIKLLHTHVDPWLVDFCASVPSRSFRWVHTYHTLYFEDHWQNGLADWQRETNRALLDQARRADVCVTVAKWLRDYLAADHGIETVYIPNGVDVDECECGTSTRFFMRYPYLHDFVLYVGSLQQIKNPEGFICLAREMPKIPFVMIGYNLSEDNMMRKAKCEIPANLYLLGPLPRRQVLDAVAACDALVMTSLSEGLPTLAMEGMLLRKPVVVPDVPGCAEVIGSEGCGYIYRRGDIRDLTNKVEAALAAPDEIRERARQRVLAEYDWRVVASQIDNLYESLGAGA